MIVSSPQNIEVEIEDLDTGYVYVYKGKCVKDCSDYFLSLFFSIRPYKILKVKNLSNNLLD